MTDGAVKLQGRLPIEMGTARFDAALEFTAREWALLVAAVGKPEMEPHRRLFHAEVCHGLSESAY